jgi:hypothetical protein
MLQEDAQEADHPVAHWLALLNGHDPEQTSHNLSIELLLVKVFLLLLPLLPALACIWRLETACFLNLPQVHH